MKKSYLLLHLAVILGGFTGVFGKLITLNEGLLVWYRVLFSAIMLLLITHLFKIKPAITSKQKLNIALVGLLITAHWVFFYGSIKYSNISVGVVCFCLASCFTAILKPLIDRVRFRFSEVGISLLTIAGISLIFSFDSSFRTGIILGVISAALNAIYTIYNEKLVKRYDSVSINKYQMMGGFVGLSLALPFYLQTFPTAHILPNLSDALYLVLLASFCTVGLYTMVIYVLKTIPAFTVNLSFNLEPVYAIILAFLFFDEGKQVSSSFYWGLLLVVISVVLQSAISIKQRKRRLSKQLKSISNQTIVNQ